MKKLAISKIIRSLPFKCFLLIFTLISCQNVELKKNVELEKILTGNKDKYWDYINSDNCIDGVSFSTDGYLRYYYYIGDSRFKSTLLHGHTDFYDRWVLLNDSIIITTRYFLKDAVSKIEVQFKENDTIKIKYYSKTGYLVIENSSKEMFLLKESENQTNFPVFRKESSDLNSIY